MPDQLSPQNLFKTGLILFVFFSPFSIAGSQIGLGIAILGWLLKFFSQKKFFWEKSFWDKPILLYLGAYIISILFSYNVKASIAAFSNEWLLLMFFLLVNNLDDHKFSRKLLDILILVSVVVAFYAIYQHYTGFDLLNQRLPEEYNLLGTTKWRSTANFSIPLTYGFHAMIVSLVSFCLASFEENKKKKLLYYFASLILVTANLFTYTRSTQIAQVFAFIIFFIFSPKTNKKTEIAMLVFYFIFIYFVDSDIYSRYQPLIKAEKISAMDLRWIVWTTSLRIFLANPITGIGFGNFQHFYQRYLQEPSQIFGHAHNDFLNVALNAGIIGLSAFLWMWFVVIKFFKKRYQKQKNLNVRPLLLSGLICVLAFLLASQFQCYYTDAEDNMLLFFIIGLAVASDKYLIKTKT